MYPSPPTDEALSAYSGGRWTRHMVYSEKGIHSKDNSTNVNVRQGARLQFPSVPFDIHVWLFCYFALSSSSLVFFLMVSW